MKQRMHATTHAVHNPPPPFARGKVDERGDGPEIQAYMLALTGARSVPVRAFVRGSVRVRTCARVS